jgi:PAS domain S-box-containing protein
MFSFRIRAKLLILVLGTLAVFFVFLSHVIVQRETRLLAGEAEEHGRLLSRAVLADLRGSMLAGMPRDTLRLLESLRGEYGLARLDVVRGDGSPAFGAPGPRVPLPQVGQAFASGRELDFEETGAVRLHTRLFPLKNSGECRPCHAEAGPVLGVTVLSYSMEDTLREIGRSARRLTGILAALIALIGGVMYFAVRRVVLRPLGELHRGAEIIGNGNLAHRIDVPARDEFRDLASTFNEMARRLKETHADLENRVKVRTAELNESLRLMRGILSSMPSGVLLLDREGRVRLINRQGARILGRVREGLAGRALADVVPEAAAFLEMRASAYEEVEVRTPDGASVPVGFTTSYYPGGGGEQEGVIVVFRDLTEIKALQAELLSKERFAAMGRVVAGVAHEIRNPLFGISAIGQIFERDLTDDAHRDLSRALVSETRRLNRLVEDLLIYGRPMKLNIGECDLRSLWEEVIGLHAEELRKRNIRVIGDYAARHPVVRLDADQIRQVFLNLLRNAMEATQDGGAITISLLFEDRFIVFKVSDTGPGIPAEQAERAFDLFFTTKPKGTGLGLAICRKIVQDHGGDISLRSEEAKGTVVTVKLPYRGGEKETAHS